MSLGFRAYLVPYPAGYALTSHLRDSVTPVIRLSPGLALSSALSFVLESTTWGGELGAPGNTRVGSGPQGERLGTPLIAAGAPHTPPGLEGHGYPGWTEDNMEQGGRSWG